MEEIVVTSTPMIPEPSSAAVSMLHQLAYVLVPYGWTRSISPSGTIFYVTPSGRVLLSKQDVEEYLREKHTCKGTLDQDQYIDEVFSFDPSFASMQLTPPPVGTGCDCERVLAQILHGDSAELQMQLLTFFAMSYLRGTQVVDQDELKTQDNSMVSIFIYLLDLLQIGTDEFLDESMPPPECLLGQLDWDDFLVTKKDGRIYQQCLSDSQLVHLSLELIMQLKDRFGIEEPFTIVPVAPSEIFERLSPIKPKPLVMAPPMVVPPQKKKRGRPPGQNKKEKKAKTVKEKNKAPLSPQKARELANKKKEEARARYRKQLERETAEQKALRLAKQKRYREQRRQLLQQPKQEHPAKKDLFPRVVTIETDHLDATLLSEQSIALSILSTEMENGFPQYVNCQ